MINNKLFYISNKNVLWVVVANLGLPRFDKNYSGRLAVRSMNVLIDLDCLISFTTNNYYNFRYKQASL